MLRDHHWVHLCVRAELVVNPHPCFVPTLHLNVGWTRSGRQYQVCMSAYSSAVASRTLGPSISAPILTYCPVGTNTAARLYSAHGVRRVPACQWRLVFWTDVETARGGHARMACGNNSDGWRERCYTEYLSDQFPRHAALRHDADGGSAIKWRACW